MTTLPPERAQKAKMKYVSLSEAELMDKYNKEKQLKSLLHKHRKKLQTV
jgi:hypothetical protein